MRGIVLSDNGESLTGSPFLRRWNYHQSFPGLSPNFSYTQFSWRIAIRATSIADCERIKRRPPQKHPIQH